MKRLALLGLVLLVGLGSPSLASVDTECCCCGKIWAPSGPPVAFATGCYTGSGVADRLIPTGISEPCVTMVMHKQTAGTDVAIWKTDEMGAGQSCAMTNGDADSTTVGTQQCTGNAIKTYNTAGGFTIGTAQAVNQAGQAYCWYQWSAASGFCKTFEYTGDGTGVRIVNPGINVDTGDTLVFIQNDAITTGNVFANHIIAKSSSRAGEGAVNWNPFTSPAQDPADAIEDFTATGIQVNAELNFNTETYRGAVWKFPGGVGGTVSWFGNGSSGGGACATLADTQNIATTCMPRGVLTLSGVDETSPCAGPHRWCNAIRATNIGPSVDGPGVITGDDYYAQIAVNPDQGNGLGGLNSSNQFVVTGAPSLEMSCNDNSSEIHEAAYWCLDAPTIGSVNAANWTFDTRLIYWDMEDASSGTRLNGNPILGPCGTDCNLTNTDTVLKDTTNFKQATASAAYSGGTDRLSCALTTCDEIKAVTTTLSIGGWVRPGAAADFEIMESESAASQFRLFFRAGSTAIRFTIRDNTFFDNNLTGAGGSAGSGTWTHAIGTWNDSGTNTMTLYTNGVSSGSSNPANSMAAIGTGTFEVGGGAPTGNVDEVFVFQGALSATDVCRIHACGWDGLQCSCFSGDPTVYIDTGRWAGTCTLPACNKLNPS